jgi:hypothetical protein
MDITIKKLKGGKAALMLYAGNHIQMQPITLQVTVIFFRTNTPFDDFKKLMAGHPF